jgi:DNA-binding NarL/FixJ family response regulator
MRVWIIDNQPIARNTLQRMVHVLTPGASVIEMDSLSQIHDVQVNQNSPDIIITDLILRDACGLIVVEQLKSKFKDAQLMIMSSIVERGYYEFCSKIGVSLYLDKTSNLDDIYSVMIRCFKEGGFEISSEKSPKKLSKRLKQLVVLLERGMSNQELALEMGISECTVKVHLYRLYKLLNVKNRMQAVYRMADNY